MKTSSRFLAPFAILLLAATALLFASGCNMDPFAYAVGLSTDEDDSPNYLILLCDPYSKTLQLYENRGYDRGPFGGPSNNPIDSPINGKSCSVSTELQGRPLTMTEAVDHGIFSFGPSAGASLRAAAAPGVPARSAQTPTASAFTTALANTFTYLMPLLFPPTSAPSDTVSITPACPAGLGTYLVNHTEGTVTSVGLCPLRVLKEITVTSNPLQAAVTPDGATLLVTSYDSAITFISTATDTVVSTLPTPNYFPSGIAISPDGTRAYVTNYFDSNPALLVIDIPNRKLLSTIALPIAYPRVVALTPDGAQAWVNYYSGTEVTIVDTLSGTISRRLNLGTGVSTGMAFNPTGTKAFVAANPNLVFIIDTASLSTLAKITVGPEPNDVIAVANGNKVFVNSPDQTGVWVIDAVHNTLLVTPPAATKADGSMGMMIYH